MPFFICPNCGHREVSGERTAGFSTRPKGCSKCGFGFVFELLDDYYPAPNAAFFVCDKQERVIDAGGLDRSDRALLDTLATKFGGGPVGLSTLAIAIGEEPDTIEDIFEPYLLQQGLLKRTPRGRVLTERAFEHLGIPVPERASSLF